MALSVLARMAVAALLVLTAFAAAPPASAATTGWARTITTSSSNPAVAFAAFDGNPAKLFDFDRDGDLEIIAQNDNNWAYIFDSRTGALKAELKTTFPSHWGARSFNGPEAYREGTTSYLVLANSAAYITKYRFDAATAGNEKWTFVKEWERRLADCHGDPGMDSKPVIHDLDRDGRYDILGNTEESGVYALRGDGSVMWKNCIGGGNADPATADLNQDGWAEVVHVSDGGVVTALNGRTGAQIWRYDARVAFALGSGSIPVGPGIGQLDGVGGPDIVFGARDSHDPENIDNNHALLAALDSNGKLLWGRRDANANPLTYTHPIVADAANDGTNEVYWGDWNTMGHKPPFDESKAWQLTGNANYYRYDNAGNLVWRTELSTYWSNKDLVLADVDGDGAQEIVANGPGSGGDGLWYLNSGNGAKETFVGINPYKVQRNAIAGDLWNTGTMQLVVEASPAATGAQGPAIIILDTHAPYNAKWPHLPDPAPLGAPVTPPPPGPAPPPPPPPTGTFDATFTTVRGNEWWVQANVAATGDALAKVEVSLNGGAWKPLVKQSWGGWAQSYQIVQGTVVQLKATSAGGATDLSDCYQWIPPSNADASKTACSSTPGEPTPPPPPPPPTGTFDASFSGVRGNEWWVQANVAASGHTIAKVDARLNGGAWKPLAKQSWGGWAASFQVTHGTVVQFQATSTSGAVDLSDCYQWIPPSNVDASKVACSGGTTPPPPPPPPSGGTFSASFTPKSSGNDNWIEVQVTSSHTVVKVQAQVNNGVWTDLSKQASGTWAKSMSAPNGSFVKFRAYNSAGAVATSGTYLWP